MEHSAIFPTKKYQLADTKKVAKMIAVPFTILTLPGTIFKEESLQEGANREIYKWSSKENKKGEGGQQKVKQFNFKPYYYWQ